MSDEDQIEYERFKIRCGSRPQLWLATQAVELLSLTGDFYE